jgi:hypothetical protein
VRKIRFRPTLKLRFSTPKKVGTQFPPSQLVGDGLGVRAKSARLRIQRTQAICPYQPCKEGLGGQVEKPTQRRPLEHPHKTQAVYLYHGVGYRP